MGVENETLGEKLGAAVERRSSDLARRIYDTPLRSLALVCLFTTFLMFGVSRLEFASDYRVYFDADDPELINYQEIESAYSKGDNALFVVTRDDGGSIYAPDSLSLVGRLTEEAWRLPSSVRVDSLTNFQHSYALEDDLIVEDLVSDPDALTQSEAREIAAVVAVEPLLYGRLAATDGRAAGVFVDFRFTGAGPDEVAQAVAAARRLADQIEIDHPDHEVALTGSAALYNALSEASAQDVSTLGPVMIVLIVAAGVVLLRSILGVIITLAIVGVSTAAAMGAAGWLGVQISPPTAAAPNMILAIAVADSMHLLVTALNRMRTGDGKRAAFLSAMADNAWPIFLTTVTTVAGLLTLNFSDQPPFRQLGNISAFGVFAAWVYTMVLTPALFALAPIRVRQLRLSTTPHALLPMIEAVIRHRTPTLAIGVCVVFTWTCLATMNRLDERFVDFFSDTLEFRQDTELATERLTGIYQMHFSVSAGAPEAVADPAYLQDLDAFAEWLRVQPGVLHVSAITDVMRRLNKNLHQDDEAYFTLPDDRELAAQYLLLYELSLPLGLDLTNQITMDKSATRVVATLDNVSSAQIQNLGRSAETWLQTNAPAHMAARGASPSVMFASVAERTTRSMLTGTLVAFAVVAAIVGLAAGSVRYALTSLAFNVTPAAIAFGVWAVFVGEVTSAATVVGAMSLGVIVDATIHILSKYKRALRRGAQTPHMAARTAIAETGPALIASSGVLIAGFCVFIFSSFSVNAQMGVLVALTLAFALAIDFFMLPPFLTVLDRARKTGYASLEQVSIMRRGAIA